MHDVLVSTIEGLHDVDDSVRKMRNLQNKGFNLVISSLSMLPTKEFHIHIPLCHMILILAMRSILEVDVQLLENEFKNG